MPHRARSNSGANYVDFGSIEYHSGEWIKLTWMSDDAPFQSGQLAAPEPLSALLLMLGPDLAVRLRLQR